MFKNIKTQNTNEYDEFLTTSNSKLKERSILNGSLIWVGLGLLFTVLFTYLEAKTQMFGKLVQNNIQTVAIVALIAVVFILIGNFTIYIMPWWLVLIYYITFTVLEGISISYLLLFALQDFTTAEFTLLLAIPAGVTLLMAILGHFNIINFGKIWPLILGLFISIIIFGIVSFFVTSHLLFTLYTSLGFIAYSLMIGFQIWKIKKMDENVFAVNAMPYKEYLKTTLIIGTSLLISILELIRFAFMLMKLYKD
ncbi:MAG0110 family membrane protein [Mycoplasma elephantis]|uniref:MAG0110 family membrane protein n=1 Tax=Mycoplasma elephantis TaxID=114882 RepID=UPI0004884F34|nr:Bax inhibitor-1 family protein [Mycoplasma elephantis]